MSLISDTAVAMTKVLASGQPVLAAEMRTRIRQEGGDPEYMRQAAKYLRDLGVPVVAKKARHNSSWRIAQAGDATAGVLTEEWALRVRREHYSEAISTARALALHADPNVAAIRQTVLQSAINLGMQMGKSINEVVADAEARTR
jgi:hypothetical protein